MDTIEKAIPADNKILIVEDSPTQAEEIKYLLEKHGYQTVVASCGEDALSNLSKQKPSLVLSDIIMPGINGYELCRQIRTDHKGSGIPVILLTSLSDSRDVIEGLKCGADCFITKPYNEQFLVSQINYALVNKELRKSAGSEMGIEIFFAGQKHLITSSRMQILDLLFSTYENAVEKNRELDFVNRDLKKIQAELKKLNEQLEEKVVERTHRIKQLNSLIQAVRNVNKLITREKDRGRLLQRACDCLTETRGYRSAGIVLTEKTGEFYPPPVTGFNRSPLPIHECLKREDLPDCIRQAISQPEVVLIKDLDPASPLTGKCKGRCAQAVRLEHGGKVYGVLIISLPNDFTIDAEEQALLREVADDIAFALHDLALEEERNRTNEALKIKTQDLSERVKELQCLYKISNVLDEHDTPFEDILLSAANIMPGGWQYPELACARIILDGKEYKTGNFRETPWMQTGEIIAVGRRVGSLEIRYLAQMPEADEVPFLKEERDLMTAIGERLGGFVERIKARDALQDSEEKYRLLVENAEEAIFIVQDGVIKFLNSKTEKLFGYSRGELANKPFVELIHPDDRNRVIETIQQAENTTDVNGTYSFRIINGKGVEVWGELNVVLVSWEKKPASLNFLRDLTKKRELERQLAQAQKMEAIGTLAGGIAHDFNNILSSIIGYSELAKDLIPGESEAADHIEQVMMAGNRAKNLVTQILAFSRRGEEETVSMQVHHTVIEALKLLRATLPTTIRIRQRIDKGCGTVLANPTQIHQVVLNLCANAYHAMREKGGELAVSLNAEEIGSDETSRNPAMKPGSYVKLTVSDTGNGIDPDVLERIFEPYFTTKPTGEGTGLGLSVTHGIVRSHNGFITVHSEPGKGADFHVYLPRIKTDKSKSATLSSKPVPRGTEHIMIVDDDEAISRMMQQSIESLGYHATAFTCSVEALGYFRSHARNIDLILTDMTMPDMTGLQLSEKLMEIRQDIPIILCTGYSDMVMEQKVKELGIGALILKPFKKKEIAMTIRDVLEKCH